VGFGGGLYAVETGLEEAWVVSRSRDPNGGCGRPSRLEGVGFLEQGRGVFKKLVRGEERV
jgi:hypothetical protein